MNQTVSDEVKNAWKWRHAITKSELPATTRHVLLTLSLNMDETGRSCFPSVDDLAEMTGLARKTVMHHLDIAVDRGWILVSLHGYGGQRWRRNEYSARWPGRGINSTINRESDARPPADSGSAPAIIQPELQCLNDAQQHPIPYREQNTNNKIFGFELLVSQTGIYYEDIDSDLYISRLLTGRIDIGGTPIERLFYCAVIMRTLFNDGLVGTWDIAWVSAGTVIDGCAGCGFRYNQFGKRIIAQSQVSVDNIGTVDFVFSIWNARDNKWRRLIVECDGHEFHERTKEQAAKDRKRDREATLKEFDIFRFTGHELWCDPWGCADQLIKWADSVAREG